VLTDGERIDLARARPMRVGRLVLDPPVRQVRHDDGAEEVVEPRVMQVLLALALSEGDIVTRDTLTERCWEGRVVGEDAINRVISRLRRLSEGIGAGSFRLETVTRIGYRLIADGLVAPIVAAAPDRLPTPQHVDRRGLIVAGAGAVLLAAGGGAWIFTRRRAPDAAVSPAIAETMGQADIALRQGTADGTTTAIGLFRRVIEQHPDYAKGWASLALAYAIGIHGAPPNLASAYEARGRQAAARAQTLDPGNVDAAFALAMLLPRMGHWREVEQACRAVLAKRPDDYRALYQLALDFGATGRCREQATLLDHATAVSTPTPSLLYQHCQSLWSAGRLDDADRATEEAFRIAPLQFQVWFTRFYLFLYTARIEQAIAMAADIDNRPTGIPTSEFDRVVAVAHAMQSRDARAIDTVEQDIVAAAHKGAGYAENSMQFASALGRLDTAFRIADAYYLNRGFTVDAVRFTPEQGAWSSLSERRSHILFLPSTAAMRTDARFARLVEEIGLGRYWRESGSKPDYRG
jgi:DNA-binding winged helix-turn-helix (wHTH) protein/tetratricopeptide (TPR) repeat protein